MKRFLLFLFVLTATLMGTFELALADIPVDEVVFTEKDAPRVDVVHDGNRLFFEAAGHTYSVDVFPQIEEMKKALGMKLPAEILEQLRARGEAPPPEANPLEAYQSLSAEQKQAFLQERVLFLKKTASVLQGTSYLSGMGSLISDKLTFLGQKAKSVFTAAELNAKVPGESISFKQRREQAIQNMLQAIDYKLWYQAPLFIASNEFGLQGHIGIVAVRGMQRKGSGGAEFLGISLGYNKTQKALVFEIYHNSERFDNTRAAVGVVGLNFFAGPFFSARDARTPAKTLKGFTFYPPVAPAASQSGPDIFSAGVATGFGFPPPPIADMYTWTDSFERRTIVRVSVSAIVPGFFRMHVGDVKGSAVGLVSRVTDALAAFGKKILPLQRRTCGAVFATF